MLNTAIQQAIKIKTSAYPGISEYAYTCYGDSGDKNTFYIVPEIPVFSAQDKKPNFMFYKYRSEDQQGGYTQFTIQLPQPTDDIKDQIKGILYKDIQPQLTARSRLIVQYVQADLAYTADPESKEKQDAMNKALSNTGLSQEQAQKYVSLYDPKAGDAQFLESLMPDGTQHIKLLTPRYTSAQATLILDDNKAFYRQMPAPLSPSGLGDNNTVFSLSLTGQGATLFEQVLKGTDNNASVGIRFALGLDASLNAATVTVTYNSKKTKEVTQTISKHTWSADEKNITRKYYESGAIKIDVQTGLSAAEMGMSQQDYNSWKSSLTEWGQKQVEQILTSQTGLDMSLDLLNDAGGFDKFQESLESTQDFTRVYTENSIVPFMIFPQAQLPSIRAIVGEKNLDQYFKEYDLNDPFYQYIQPEFYVSQDLKKYNIENIVVTAKYDDNNVSTLVFDQKDASSKKTNKWYIDKKLGRTYSYSYQVNFSGLHAKPYLSGKIEVVDSLVQSINTAQCGIVYAQIDALLYDQGWQKFSQVVVKTQYSDPANKIELKSDTQVLSPANPPQPFIYPVGMTPVNPIYFSADYYTKDGSNFTYIPVGIETSPQLPGYGATRANQIQIFNALPKTQTYTILFILQSKDVLVISLDMTVNYKAYKFQQTQSINLEESELGSGTIKRSLSFGLLPDGCDDIPEISYSGIVVYSGDKEPQVLSGTPTSGSVIIKC
ncbi:hypothetical protein [Dickeya lacustris]|uniref:Uncharacterized protein n=1 Tax=Dickeya lacustris TaxID=2259638 RepID=A0ABY8G724_9GAMM|nr:hypothetical protein [Dickeya lacustris]WFN55761.1 hypothetical protein O1Q98_19730 [Dickeya lacustris]